MKTVIVLFSVLLLCWIAGSSYVYVCKVRHDCCADTTAAVDTMAVPQAPADTMKAAAAVPVLPVPPPLTLYFDFNVSTCAVTAENTAHFELIKQYLAANAGKKILVTGHSDNKGPEVAKEKIGAQRADFIKQKLVEAGIAADAIGTVSESDRKPAADNGTDEGRTKNRRAEIIIQ